MAVETRYFCTGTCGAVVTQEQYDEGLVHCEEKTCNMYGIPFEKGLFCTTCQRKIEASEQDQHQH
ncbi:MAG: hypothetical protein A2134_02195 [Candidatus Woykebacteria bacterium RBG_16_39_9b]|uniref:Uncharacterized protein n=1 Tax=Candidatus Woykebacteria bacterium RBG_16_39_9b TaxID=1802595 RepID=A0A1G1WBZ4_9BACT|nr:MAG: hypothetical protein A2134_02195 [Candidatus Woykebacteria bacterium RBG_16_39_9b]